MDRIEFEELEQPCAYESTSRILDPADSYVSMLPSF